MQKLTNNLFNNHIKYLEQRNSCVITILSQSQMEAKFGVNIDGWCIPGSPSKVYILRGNLLEMLRTAYHESVHAYCIKTGLYADFHNTSYKDMTEEYVWFHERVIDNYARVFWSARGLNKYGRYKGSYIKRNRNHSMNVIQNV